MGSQRRIEFGRSLARGRFAYLGRDREEDADDLIEARPSVDRRVDVREIGRQLPPERDRRSEPSQCRALRVQPRDGPLRVRTHHPSERPFVMHAQATQCLLRFIHEISVPGSYQP